MASPLQRIQGVPYAIAKTQDNAAATTSQLAQAQQATQDQVDGLPDNAGVASAYVQAKASNQLAKQGQQVILGASPGGGVFVGAYLASGTTMIWHRLGRQALGVRLAVSYAARSSFDAYQSPNDNAQTNQNQQNAVLVTATAAGLCVLEVL